MKITTCSDRKVIVPCSLQNFTFQIDPYIGCSHLCHYCYVLKQAETDWSKEILIHEDIELQINNELEGITPQKIYMGYYTDPYQPCERESFQTRKVLEVLLEKGFSVSILTKSDLVLRDLDVLQEMHDASVSVSTAFTDNLVRLRMEGNTIETDARIEALRQLSEAGVHTSALICPVIPYLSDARRLVGLLAPITEKIWIYRLSIEKRTDQNWQHLQSILLENYPELSPRIAEIIFSQEHEFWQQLRQELESISQERDLNLSIHI